MFADQSLKFLNSPGENDVRTHLTINWLVEVIITQHGEQKLSLSMPKMVKKYPFLKDSNYYLTLKNYSLLTPKKEGKSDIKPSREETKKLYNEMLNNGEFETRAELARHFEVSRAWVSMVLNN